jgi:cbb3-type cytochrome oxidase maturation protein
MEILFVLIGVSVLVAVIFLIVLLVNMRSGQYDDMYTPSVRILFDKDKNITKDENRSSSSSSGK